MINLYDIDMSKIAGTGPHGSIMKNDVKDYIQAHGLSPKVAHAVEAAQPEPPKQKTEIKKPQKSEHEPQFVDIELTNMRKVIAKRLLLSKVTLSIFYK